MSVPHHLDLVTLGGVVYRISPRQAPPSRRRCHGGPLLDFINPEGKVAGTITLRRTVKTGYLLAHRRGVGKLMTEPAARRLLASYGSR